MTDQYRPVRDIQPPPSPVPELRQTGPKPLRILLALMSTAVLVVSGMGYFTVGRLGDTVAGASNLNLGGGTRVKKGEQLDGATDILLVGSDSRSDAQGNPLTPEEIAMLRAGDEANDNTDTIMVIRVPNDGSSATAISIPRDTYIHDDEMGNTKINGVYGAYKAQRKEELVDSGVTDENKLEEQSKDAGRKALINSVADLTGITVDHYAEVGLLGFVLLTDAVGGVEVCLNDAVYDEFSGADFPAGRQKLSGPDALSFVRQRHGLPRGDLDRIVRQQSYMASLVNHVLSSRTLSNPKTLTQLGEAVSRSVIIDEDWDVMSFANQLQNLAGGRVQFTTIPVTSIDGVGDYGESVVTVDVDSVHDFFDTLLGDGGEEPGGSPETPVAPDGDRQPVPELDVHVLNATTVSGKAGRVAGAVKDLGYRIGEVSNAPDGLYPESVIVAADGGDPAVRLLSEQLGGLRITESPTLVDGEAVVAVASDWSGPIGDEPVDGDAGPDGTDGGTVGQPGPDAAPPAPVINAGGNGPRCVN
ncbi:LCP family protein [Corynebacterium pygosceleis]|uniref:LCP family protein n=1 Tax=Corynebacterium pygosceleis TaxID=2800406 RepID=A0A9Q4C7G4_9CORY|nr:LCP family protein [Corynebacterium pygosceleis]MCK7637691.1 LCP family protein [Corynebacterium pygosceleis]MCK7674882.1 LCP family protein [Corynebacterium pygosceleis]MCL0119529.1 LCP family protein [Corynebacterium pygosceleis]MCX7444769.1 LCP family protein [Corynebacterium pygosceleis]MCX7467980.1 LCP family protein [Corynebacterium pygosceleis]